MVGFTRFPSQQLFHLLRRDSSRMLSTGARGSAGNPRRSTWCATKMCWGGHPKPRVKNWASRMFSVDTPEASAQWS